MMKRTVLFLMIFFFSVSLILPVCITVIHADFKADGKVCITMDVCKKKESSPIKNLENFLTAGTFVYIPIYSEEKIKPVTSERYLPPYIPPRFRPPATV